MEVIKGKRRSGISHDDPNPGPGSVINPPGKISAVKLPLINQVSSNLKKQFPDVDAKMIQHAVNTAIGYREITEDNVESITNDAAASIIYKNTILSELQETFPGVVGIDSMIDEVIGTKLITGENADDVFVFDPVFTTIVRLRKEGAEEILGKNGFPVTEENVQATTETMIQLQQYFLETNPGEDIHEYVYGALNVAISKARTMASDMQQTLDLALNIVGAQIICNNFGNVKQISEACVTASKIISHIELPEGTSLSESCFFTIAKCVMDIFDEKQRPYNLSLLQQKIFERTSKQPDFVEHIIEQSRSERLSLVKEEMGEISSEKSDLAEETTQQIAEAEIQQIAVTKIQQIAEETTQQIGDERIESAIISAATKILKRDENRLRQEQEQEQELEQELGPELELELELSLDELFEISVETIVNGDEITILRDSGPFEKAEKKDDMSEKKNATPEPRSYEVGEVVEDYVPEPINPSILSDADLDEILDSAIAEITSESSMTAMESEFTSKREETIQTIQTIKTIQTDKSVFDRLNTLAKKQQKQLKKINSFTPKAFTQEALSQEALSQEALSQEALSQEALSQEALSQEALSQEALSQEALSQGSFAPEALSQGSFTEEKQTFIENEKKTIKKTWRTLQELVESLEDPSQSENYKLLRQTYTIVGPGANINMASLFAEDDGPIVKPEKRRGVDGDSSDSEDEDSPDRGPPSSPPNTFLVDQGGDGVCFILAVLYLICKLFFTLFAILYPDARFVKPSAFTQDEIKILNATITVNGTIDPDALNALLSLLLKSPHTNGEPQNYVYNIAVVYVFLFVIAINLMNDKNGEDPSKGGYAVSSLLLMIHFLYTIIAEEPELSEDDEENFRNFEAFYLKYVTQDSSKKLKYPHNYYAYKLLVFMMKRVKYGVKPVQGQGQGPPPVRLPDPGCPVLKVAGDDIKNPLGKLNEITINQLVAHNKKMGFLTSYCALGVNHEWFDAFYQFLVILGKMRLNKKKIVTNHEQIIASLKKVKDRHDKYKDLIPTLRLPPSNTSVMLKNVETYISAAQKDIDGEIAKQKQEIADLNARLKIKKKPFIDKLEQVKRDNEVENHVVTLVVRVDGGVQYFRLMNTWTGKYKTPWFEADFLWKYMGVSNVFNDFRVSVVSCAFLFTPENEISNQVIAHFGTAVSVPRESLDVSLCKQLYVSVVTVNQELFDSVISKFVNGPYYAHKIVKSLECKRMINDVIRHLIGTAGYLNESDDGRLIETAEIKMLHVMLNTFGKATGYQIDGLSHEHTVWSYPARSEQLGYLAARVLATYAAFHSCAFGSRTATIISPKSIDLWRAFAQNCIESAIDGEEYTIQEIYSIQLWMVFFYLIKYCQPLFARYEEARSEFPGSAHSVVGRASGKLCVIPRRSSIFKEIEHELEDLNERHNDAESTVSDFIGRIENNKRKNASAGALSHLDPKVDQQLKELREMWRKISESLETTKIPVDDFDASIRILSELIRNFERGNVTFPLPSYSASASGSSLSGSSQGSSSSDVLKNAYGPLGPYGMMPDSQGSQDSSPISPESARTMHFPQVPDLTNEPNRDKKNIIQEMYDKLDYDKQYDPRFIDDERITSEFITQFGPDAYKTLLDQQQQTTMEIGGGGSRKKVFQRRTKKQKTNNNKKYRKTKMHNKNNNKKRSRKPSKKRHPLKTNANTKRKKF